MIDRLDGRPVGIGASVIYLRVGPAVLEVHAPASTLAAVGGEGADVTLWTTLHWKEDGPTLFGFATRDERVLFQLLLGVQGVGPRIALGALSALPPGELLRHLRARDAEALTRVPGIGAKTAGRILVELGPQADRLEMEPAAAPEAALGSAARDAVLALTALGYPQRDARSAVEAVLREDPAAPVDACMRRALRHLAGAASQPTS